MRQHSARYAIPWSHTQNDIYVTGTETHNSQTNVSQQSKTYGKAIIIDLQNDFRFTDYSYVVAIGSIIGPKNIPTVSIQNFEQ
mgnify:CR=1 FL=1